MRPRTGCAGEAVARGLPGDRLALEMLSRDALILTLAHLPLEDLLNVARVSSSLRSVVAGEAGAWALAIEDLDPFAVLRSSARALRAAALRLPQGWLTLASILTSPQGTCVHTSSTADGDLKLRYGARSSPWRDYGSTWSPLTLGTGGLDVVLNRFSYARRPSCSCFRVSTECELMNALDITRSCARGARSEPARARTDPTARAGAPRPPVGAQSAAARASRSRPTSNCSTSSRRAKSRRAAGSWARRSVRAGCATSRRRIQ